MLILKKVVVPSLLLIVSVLLYAFSFPSLLAPRGVGFLIFVAFVPLFYLLKLTPFKVTPLIGALFGLLSYLFLTFWMKEFDDTAFYGIPLLQASYFLLLIPLLKKAGESAGRWGTLLQAVLWAGHEVLKTSHLLAHSFGIVGYAHYRYPAFIGIADLVGVYGISLITIFVNATIARHLFNTIEKRAFEKRGVIVDTTLICTLLLSSFIYSFIKFDRKEASDQVKVALIQHNVDTWLNNKLPNLIKANNTLMALSQEVEGVNPDLIIWPETSVNPSIRWNNRYRTNRSYYEDIVRKTLQHLAKEKRYYLIGNNDSELDENGERINRNSALLFYGSEIKEIYHKVILVPFSEFFPFETILQGFKNRILEKELYFYVPGESFAPIQIDTYRAGVMICFEDTFPKVSRIYGEERVDFLIGLTNDSWASHYSGAYHHFATALFRAVESRKPFVRASTNGVTAIISSDGRVDDLLAAKREGTLVGSVTPSQRVTVHTLWGGIIEKIYVGASVLGILLTLFRRRTTQKPGSRAASH